MERYSLWSIDIGVIKDEKDLMRNWLLLMVNMCLLLIEIYGIKYSLNVKRVVRNYKFMVKE